MNKTIVEALLSAAISDEISLSLLLSKCQPKMFAGYYRSMYEILKYYEERSLRVDSNLFRTDCASKGVPDNIVQQVLSQPFSQDSVEGYIEHVNFEYTRRIVSDFSKLLPEAISDCKTKDDILSSLEKTLDSHVFSQQNDSSDATISIKDNMSNYLEHLTQRASLDGDAIGLKTPLTDLNKLTKGLVPKDLIVLAARPSMGKTAMLVSMLMDAIMDGEEGLLFSIEMPIEQMMHRLISARTGIDLSNLMTGRLTDFEKISFKNCLRDIESKAKLHINDKAGITVSEVCRIARHLHRRSEKGLKFIAVDYLQIMQDSDMDGETRSNRVGQITTKLKGLAKELNLPVILLSQLSRNLEQRADKRPINSDLRESGSIEQDADIIMFIYRDEVYNAKSKDAGLGELIIGKHRNGPLGTIKLKFEGKHTRFVNNR